MTFISVLLHACYNSKMQDYIHTVRIALQKRDLDTNVFSEASDPSGSHTMRTRLTRITRLANRLGQIEVLSN